MPHVVSRQTELGGKGRRPKKAEEDNRRPHCIGKEKQDKETSYTRKQRRRRRNMAWPCMWRALYVASLFQIANRGKNGSSVKCTRNGPTSSAHQATRAVHTRLHEQCTPGYTSRAQQATRAVHTRLHEQCTTGYTSSAHQATRAVHTRLHEQCTPGYTSSAHQATRAVHTRLHEQCTPG